MLNWCKLYRWWVGGSWYFVHWVNYNGRIRKRYWTRECPSAFDAPYEMVFASEHYGD